MRLRTNPLVPVGRDRRDSVVARSHGRFRHADAGTAFAIIEVAALEALFVTMSLVPTDFSDDAEAALEEFTLEGQIQQQEELKEKAQEAAEEGIQRLVEAFQRGDITAREFTRALNNQLQPAIDDLPKANLGLQFNRDFLRNVNALVKQAEALSGFLGRPGTTPGPGVEEPGLTVAEAKARVQKAQQDLKEQLKNIKDTADNTKAAETLLTEIRDALAKPPKPQPKPRRRERPRRDVPLPGRLGPGGD